MKVLIIKDIENVPGEMFTKGDILDLWPDTAERLIKEKAAINVPENINENEFKNSIINKKNK